MKKIFISIFILASVISFAAKPVVEVGQNVRMNTLAKIEQAKATIENIKQTKNQIIQLKNDALNLNKWANVVLNDTLGISQKDIEDVLAIKRESEALIKEARNLQKNWKSEFKLDYSKLDPNQLANENEKTLRELEAMRSGLGSYDKEIERLEKKGLELKKNLQEFNSKNRVVEGNVQAMQLTNEILGSLYSSVNQVNDTLKYQEAIRRHKEELEEERKKINDAKSVEFLQKENEMREHENTLLSLQTTLISLEDKIEEKKLTIATLKNRNADKEKITLEEKRLNALVAQKQITQKDIVSEKKIIEKIQKNLEIEYKLNGLKKEIHSIKKEVVNGEETAFKVKYIDNKIKNIFLVSLLYLKAYISKKIFRKNVENYNGIKKVARNIKVRIATSLILAIILSFCFLITLKFISSAKEHYVSFGETNTTAVDTTEEMKKQKEAEEKAKILEAQEKAEAARIDSDAQDEEITAKLAGTFTSYAFDVDRQVTVNKKIHAFKSASWSDQGEVIEPGTKLTVNKIVSPAGYLMYQISSGNLQGQFITANEKFVSVDSKNDELENFISRPVAIKFLATQNVYSDEAASKVRVTFGNGAQLNINGIGINNNRLIYHVSDGSFVPVNPVRVIEVNRETPKTKNIDSNDNKNASNSQSNQRTTR